MQSVTVTVPPSGKVKLGISAGIGNSSSGVYSGVAYSSSGANTISASDDTGLFHRSNVGIGGAEVTVSMVFMITGLTPGSTTFTMKFRSSTGGTANFERREIWVEA